jgi:hypothetical protein
VFLYGFAKSDRDNISASELSTARSLGGVWLSARIVRIARAIDQEELQEISDGEEAT